jgi:hypothetical protein
MNITNKYVRILWDQRILLVSIVAGIFIYFRTLDYYKSIPRHSVIASLAVIAWSYATLKEPLFLIVGLVLLNLFGEKHPEEEISFNK